MQWFAEMWSVRHSMPPRFLVTLRLPARSYLHLSRLGESCCNMPARVRGSSAEGDSSLVPDAPARVHTFRSSIER